MEYRTKVDPWDGHKEKEAAPEPFHWLKCSQDERPAIGNRWILAPYCGMVRMLRRDRLTARWEVVGSGNFPKYILDADLEHWAPVPDVPKEPEPHDAFTSKPWRTLMGADYAK